MRFRYLRVLSGWLYQGVVFDEARELFIQAGAGGKHGSMDSTALHVPAPLAIEEAGLQDDAAAGVESGLGLGNYAYRTVDWSHARVNLIGGRAVPTFMLGEVSATFSPPVRQCLCHWFGHLNDV